MDTHGPAEILGNNGYEFSAPGIAPPAAGCALVAGSGSGTQYQLGWSLRPVLMEPAVGPLNSNQYFAADKTWKSIPPIDSGSVVGALGYTPANRAGDTFSGDVDFQQSNLGTNQWWRQSVDNGLAGTDGLSIQSLNTSVGFKFRRDGVFSANAGVFTNPANYADSLSVYTNAYGYGFKQFVGGSLLFAINTNRGQEIASYGVDTPWGTGGYYDSAKFRASKSVRFGAEYVTGGTQERCVIDYNDSLHIRQGDGYSGTGGNVLAFDASGNATFSGNVTTGGVVRTVYLQTINPSAQTLTGVAYGYSFRMGSTEVPRVQIDPIKGLGVGVNSSGMTAGVWLKDNSSALSFKTDAGVDAAITAGAATFSGTANWFGGASRFVQVSPDNGGQASIRLYNVNTDAYLRTTATSGEVELNALTFKTGAITASGPITSEQSISYPKTVLDLRLGTYEAIKVSVVGGVGAVWESAYAFGALNLQNDNVTLRDSSGNEMGRFNNVTGFRTGVITVNSQAILSGTSSRLTVKEVGSTNLTAIEGRNAGDVGIWSIGGYDPLIIGSLSQTVALKNLSGSAWSTLLAGGAQFNDTVAASAFHTASTGGLYFSSNTNPANTKDAAVIRSGVGQVDVVGDSGLRVLNYAGNSYRGVTASTGTFFGAVNISGILVGADIIAGGRLRVGSAGIIGNAGDMVLNANYLNINGGSLGVRLLDGSTGNPANLTAGVVKVGNAGTSFVDSTGTNIRLGVNNAARVTIDTAGITINDSSLYFAKAGGPIQIKNITGNSYGTQSGLEFFADGNVFGDATPGLSWRGVTYALAGYSIRAYRGGGYGLDFYAKDVAGTERAAFQIQADANVLYTGRLGIGAAPAYDFHVHSTKTARFDGPMVITNSMEFAGSSPYMQFNNNVALRHLGYFAINGPDNGNSLMIDASRNATFGGNVTSTKVTGSNVVVNDAVVFEGRNSGGATSQIFAHGAAKFDSTVTLASELILDGNNTKGLRMGSAGYRAEVVFNSANGNLELSPRRDLGMIAMYGTFGQGYNSLTPTYRSRMLAAGQRASEVGDGAGAWSTVYREDYNAGVLRFGWGSALTPLQSIAATATDAASTQALANSIRTILLNLGLVI